mmetsp:Transcript_26118/g.84543  ORF Transcript_26118/g.84543 Transcript_26118/m.84543 type:complete len:169 (-) Transcript_26118:1113-1619(-)
MGCEHRSLHSHFHGTQWRNFEHTGVPMVVIILSSIQFNFRSDLCISGSIDRTCKVWDVASGLCLHTLRGHSDEILDVCYNATGSRLATASADGTSRVFNVMTGACQSVLIGHDGEISKVAFDPPGTRILTASSDKSARLWDAESGDCLQVSHIWQFGIESRTGPGRPH